MLRAELLTQNGTWSRDDFLVKESEILVKDLVKKCKKAAWQAAFCFEYLVQEFVGLVKWLFRAQESTVTP